MTLGNKANKVIRWAVAVVVVMMMAAVVVAGGAHSRDIG